MRRWLILLLPAAAAVALLWQLELLPGFRPEPQELRLASWNIRIFSTGSRDDAELPLTADRLEPYDLVAIQELRDGKVVDRTLQLLADRGHSFRAVVSPPVGRGVKERYAFLYRPGKVQVLGLERLYPGLGLLPRRPVRLHAGDDPLDLRRLEAGAARRGVAAGRHLSAGPGGRPR